MLVNTTLASGKHIIYQILPRLWGDGRFCDIDARTLDYIKGLGVSHVWYTGVLRHSTLQSDRGCVPSHPQIVKGQAGSPYAITDYFDVDPWLSSDPSRRLEEFKELVDRTHDAGLKVIIDFVPNHLAREYGRFSRGPLRNGLDADSHPVFGALDDKSVHWAAGNDFYYYPGERLSIEGEDEFVRRSGLQPFEENPAKATGNSFSPRPGKNDWYDTVRLNYCDFRTATWDKMLEAVRFWAAKGVDAFRCDMVEMVPPAFMKWLIANIKSEFPGTGFIAEVYQKQSYARYEGEVGFDLLYDKSGLYDILRALLDREGPRASAREISWNWQFLGDIQDHMLNFLENHDEQRFASGFFGGEPGKVFAALSTSLCLNRAPFMLYFGQEAGERGEGDGRTSIFDISKGTVLQRLWSYVHGLPGLTAGEESLLERYRGMLRQAAGDPLYGSGQTYDLGYCNISSQGFDADRHFAFLRSFEGRTRLYFSNFSPDRADASIIIPQGACGLDRQVVSLSADSWDFACADI